MNHPDDGKFVVVQDGKRVSGTLHETEQKAKEEADRQRKLRESQGQAAKEQAPVEVKRNLYG